MDTKGHLIDQPGLRAHSVDPDNNLMKRYVVAYQPLGGIGWIWERSFDTAEDGWQYIIANIKTPTKVQLIDTKTDTIIYQD